MYWHFTNHIALLQATHHWLLTQLDRWEEVIAGLHQLLG